MTHTTIAPRHRELARLAIARAETRGEPLVDAVAWAIEHAIVEASGVPDLSLDRRFRSLPRLLAILRLRGSATPTELAAACGWTARTDRATGRHMAWAALQRLTRQGFARRAGAGRYVPSQPVAIGRPPTARRRGAA